jgi:hypothetical protein
MFEKWCPYCLHIFPGLLCTLHLRICVYLSFLLHMLNSHNYCMYVSIYMYQYTHIFRSIYPYPYTYLVFLVLIYTVQCFTLRVFLYSSLSKHVFKLRCVINDLFSLLFTTKSTRGENSSTLLPVSFIFPIVPWRGLKKILFNQQRDK